MFSKRNCVICFKELCKLEYYICTVVWRPCAYCFVFPLFIFFLLFPYFTKWILVKVCSCTFQLRTLVYMWTKNWNIENQAHCAYSSLYYISMSIFLVNFVLQFSHKACTLECSYFLYARPTTCNVRPRFRLIAHILSFVYSWAQLFKASLA